MKIEKGKRVKTGGRKKGSKNVTNAKREAAIKASGMTPLDYLLSVMRNDLLPDEQRVDAAKAAAPYVHPKLASVEHKGDKDNPINVNVGFRWMTEQEARSRGWA